MSQEIPTRLQVVASHVTMDRKENKYSNDAPEESQIWTQILYYLVDTHTI
jgi:hypothetical protein